MDIAHLSHLEVTQRDPWKSARGCPVYAIDEILDNIESIQVIFCSQKPIQHEQLWKDIDEVEHLGGHVQSYQIVPVTVTTDNAQMLRKEMFTSETASAPVFSLVIQIVIQMANHVLDGLVPPLWIQGILDGFCCLYEVVDVDTWSVTKDSPEEAWQVEQEGLDKQYNRNPLVVSYVLLNDARLSCHAVTW